MDPRQAKAIDDAMQQAVRMYLAGQVAEASAVAQRVAGQIGPDAAALNHCGVLAGQAGWSDAAEALFRKAVAVAPGDADFHCNLGFALNGQKRYDDAIESYRTSLQLRSHNVSAFYNMGITLHLQKRYADAIAAYGRAIQIDPRHAQAMGNLGMVFREQGKVDEALATLQRAIAIQPNFPYALNNIGNILRELGRPDEAIDFCTRAMHCDANYSSPYNNIGNAFKDQGRIDEAMTAYSKAFQLNPADPALLSNRLYLLHFHPAYDSASILREHREYERVVGVPAKAHFAPHLNTREPDRRLRVGYVSPDFSTHPVGRFMLPLLKSHDREQVQTYCYADVAAADALTQQISSNAGTWRNLQGLDDAAVTEMIRQDRIDILVDLTMHTAGNRLGVFARKPAPVQISYLAYCSTTGLRAIDYRLTDPYLDPPGTDHFYSEKSIRLPATYWCYAPGVDTPAVAPLPATTAGCITFACLNNFCKVSKAALLLWSQIVRAVPSSRLILYCKAGSQRQRTADFFSAQGVDASRLEFVEQQPIEDYFHLYSRIDLCLDPFPCAGGTSTFDALWMGAPVVSLSGRTAVSRAGRSILTNAGLSELVADTTDTYARIAVELAKDLPRLAKLRAGLRDRLQRGRLTDAPAFARDIETVYRDVWKTWAQSK